MTKKADGLGAKISPVTYMVTYNHMCMPGGVFDYGSAKIVEYYDTFEEADRAAVTVFEENWREPNLYVWVTRCIKTYTNNGIALDPDLEKIVGGDVGGAGRD
jgi:hypothetical protein